ncbi:hypothetical protein [Variovorax sp.]|uniref:hypothetical protein n=1 Tax=Variovorax sp. TaxID=1871043 RepID=UPI002D34461A|nr:hypothetical protein [Variovorax sp.]HYP81912.1 hypothetical protein [Variovorax sp.]
MAHTDIDIAAGLGHVGAELDFDLSGLFDSIGLGSEITSGPIDITAGDSGFDLDLSGLFDSVGLGGDTTSGAGSVDVAADDAGFNLDLSGLFDSVGLGGDSTSGAGSVDVAADDASFNLDLSGLFDSVGLGGDSTVDLGALEDLIPTDCACADVLPSLGASDFDIDLSGLFEAVGLTGGSTDSTAGSDSMLFDASAMSIDLTALLGSGDIAMPGGQHASQGSETQGNGRASLPSWSDWASFGAGFASGTSSELPVEDTVQLAIL